MHWTERERARVNLALALRDRGWNLYGWKDDKSDAMTDTYDPARWDGIAEKDGYVVVVDVAKGSSLLRHSGGQKTTRQVRGEQCGHCGGSGKEPGGWTLEQARAAPREFNRSWTQGGWALLPDVVSPRLFDDQGEQKCLKCHGLGHGWTYEEVTIPWPVFHVNPTHKLWHLEKDGQVIDGGIGLGPCGDWDRQRAKRAAEELAARIERAIHTCHAREAAGVPPTADDVTIRRNPAMNGIEVVFSNKPELEVRGALKSLGFRWSPRQGLWYARYSAHLWRRVHELLNVSDDGQSSGDAGLEEAPRTHIIVAPATLPARALGSAPEPEEQPWQLTRLAYQEGRALRVAGGVAILNARDGRVHEAAVREAVAASLPIPAHVLADYPDLVTHGNALGTHLAAQEAACTDPTPPAMSPQPALF